jgi:hypothetical protein
MYEKPLINHIAWIGPDGEWHYRGFLPLYNHVLKWAVDMNCPQSCQLAPRCHPMVDNGKGAYHKLCTLTAIKAGLIKEKELI